MKRYAHIVILSAVVGLLILLPFADGGRAAGMNGLIVLAAGIILLVLPMLAPERTIRLATQKKVTQIPAVALVVFLVSAAISTATAVSKHTSYTDFLLLAALAVLFFAVARLNLTIKEYRFIAGSVVGVGLLLIIVGLFSYIPGSYSRMTSLFGWPNALGGYLLFALPASVAFFLRAKNTKDALIFGGIAAVIATGIGLTQTRGVYLAAPIGLLPVLWLFRHKVKKAALRITLGVAVVFLLTSLVMSLQGGSVDLFSPGGDDFFSDPAPTGEQSIQRFVFWRGALAIWQNNPVFGAGPATYGLVYPQHQPGPLDFAKYAHNEYVEMLAELGAAGFSIFVVLFGSLGLLATRRLWRARPEENSALYLASFFGGMLGSAAHVFVDFDWAFPANAVTFWVFAGLAYGLILKQKSDEHKE